MPFVDVQHPEQWEWTRYFKTPEEAARYHKHVTEDRGCIASIRPEPVTGKVPERPWRFQQRIREVTHGKRTEYQDDGTQDVIR